MFELSMTFNGPCPSLRVPIHILQEKSGAAASGRLGQEVTGKTMRCTEHFTRSFFEFLGDMQWETYNVPMECGQSYRHDGSRHERYICVHLYNMY